MKILINCLNLLSGSQGAGGAGSYIYSLIIELAKLETVRILVKPNNYLRFQQVKNLQVILLIDNNIEVIHQNLSWADIYFCPLNELVPQYLYPKVPVVSTILDLQHEVYPHYFKNGVYESRRAHYGYAISRANGILTISDNEKSRIQRIYNKKNVYVTYLSGYLADQFSSEEQQIKISKNQIALPQDPYIIYPAIPWRHKNHHRLVEALWMLKQSRENFKNLKLILTGAQHGLASSSLENLINSLEMQETVEMKGFINDLDLATLISNARLMIFPSLYEGFGIPIVDAMRLGTPVLTTSLAAIPEIAGEGVAYLQNPLDSKRIAKDLYSLLIDEKKLSCLTQVAKEKSNLYSSEKTAHSTLNAFQNVLKCHINAPVNLDYIDIKAIPQYKHIVKYPKTSLVLNCLEWLKSNDGKDGLPPKLNDIFEYYQNNCKFILILPEQYELEFSHINILPIYYLKENESYFNNFLNYVFDCVIDTEYVMYSSIDEFFKFYKDINLSEAITVLDSFSHLSSVKFTKSVSYPTEIAALSDIKLLQKYDQWKNRRLEFFELMILRSSSQNQEFHLGQFKFLSKFLSESYYLEYPITVS